VKFIIECTSVNGNLIIMLLLSFYIIIIKNLILIENLSPKKSLEDSVY